MDRETFVVTGATSGIGKAVAYGLATTGQTVLLVARDKGRGEAARAEIQGRTQNPDLKLFLGDLASLASVREVGLAIASQYPRLSVLVNSASVVKRDRHVSPDGFELMFATNHLGPFLLTDLLLDALKAGGEGRILNITAPSTVKPNFDDLQSERKFSSLNAFGATKMMNLLFTFELARRLEGTGVTANAIHPGLARSNLMNESNALVRWIAWLASAPPERRAESIVQVATAAEFADVNGKFLHEGKQIEASAYAYDREAQARLWEISAELAGLVV